MQGGGTFLGCPLVQMHPRGPAVSPALCFFLMRLASACMLSNINYTVMEGQYFVQSSQTNLVDSVDLCRNDGNTYFVPTGSRSVCIKMHSRLDARCV